ncbi:MAG: histidine--tRNA ligase [Coriobacteriales bacterium]|jgi:histidyl-tRNA synthetase|nr:histidine--tRNA ligase [Coriobacteriales bacterium]
MTLKNPAGVNDLLPDAAYRQHQLIRTAFRVFGCYGYRYMETPLFEKTEVFTRGIGEATDVVGKEMYYVYPMSSIARVSVEDTSALESLALRPENTAGIARAAVQHNLVPPGAPQAKLWYAGSMFRHERQQKGRYREFRQIGAECIGATEPSADAEVIVMLLSFFDELGIGREQRVLKINSMGDEACRPAYRGAVRDYILTRESEFCPECQRRAISNPLRAFDCKSEACQAALSDAPRITDYLCEECASQYAEVKRLLDSSGRAYEEDPRLVRGLDYYTRTVFEVQVDIGLGTQNALGGGGRYDRLLQEYGAKPTPSLGFAVGLERIVMVLEALGRAPVLPPAARVFVAAVDEDARSEAFALALKLREAGVSVELDHQARSLKSQLKVADKIGAGFVVILGPDEKAQGCYTLRDMTDGTQLTVTHEQLLEYVREGQASTA